MLGHAEEAMQTDKQIIDPEPTAVVSESAKIKATFQLALAEHDLGMLDEAKRDAQTATAGFTRTSPEDRQNLIDSNALVAEIDLLQGRCTENSLRSLENQWNYRKQHNASPSHWKIAESRLYVGLCRQQMSESNPKEVAKLIATSAKELITSPIADPHAIRLARPNLATLDSKGK